MASSNSSVLRSAGVVGVFTMLSRVLGLFREVLMFNIFGGTSFINSKFGLAFMIPNLFRRLFGEGALSSAFVPTFVETKEREGLDEAYLLANKIFSALIVVLSVVSVVVVIAASLIATKVLNPEEALFLDLLRIMQPYTIFICLVALCMALLNSLNHFVIPAATPCLLNTVWICALVFVVPKFSGDPIQQIHVVAWAILIAGALQLSAQLPMMLKKGFRPKFILSFHDSKVRRIITVALPMAMAAAVTQVNVLIDRLIADSFAGDHAVSALVFSERLIYLPLGLFATALGTVLLPTFSKQGVVKESGEIKQTLNYSIRNLLFIMVPAAGGLYFLATPIVEMIYAWKPNMESSVFYVSTALKFYAPGLIVFSLAKIFIPLYYARGETKTPFKLSLITVALNLVLNISFVLTWPAEYKHAGLAAATVIAETFYVIMLALMLQRKEKFLLYKSIGISFVKSLVAMFIMGVFAVWISQHFVSLLDQLGAPRKVIQIGSVLGSIGLAGLVYFAVSILLRSAELSDMAKALNRRKKG